jgi:Flp pilus assembly protein TadD
MRPELDTVNRIFQLPHDTSNGSTSGQGRSVLLKAASSSYPSSETLPPEFQRQFQRAVTLARGTRLNEAVSILDDLLALAPGFGPALRLLGLLLHKTGRDVEAVDAFNRALIVNPGDSESTADKCAVEALLAPAKADADCNAALLNHPTAPTYLILSIIQHSKGETTQAYALITQSIDIQPSDLSLTLRGMLSAQQGSNGSAERDFARAAQLNASLSTSR